MSHEKSMVDSKERPYQSWDADLIINTAATFATDADGSACDDVKSPPITKQTAN